MQHWSWVALLAVAMFAPGCGNPTPPDQPSARSSSGAKGDAAAVKKYAAEDLPPVEDTVTGLDSGRVEVAGPKGWRRLPRETKYIARYVKGKDYNSLPRITISPGMRGPVGIADVTEENVAEFVAQMQEKSEAIPGRKMIEPCRPIMLGENLWSRHVRRVSLDRRPAVVQALETVRGGWLYVIEITALSAGETNEDFKQAILSCRDDGYAVAASWKFTGDAAAPATQTVAGEQRTEASGAQESKSEVASPPPSDKPPDKTPDKTGE